MHAPLQESAAKKAPGGPGRQPEAHPAAPQGDLVESLGAGRALDASTRGRMEPVIGVALDHVRIHEDARASAVADAHDARALTFGNHVAFAAGQHRPGTPAGDALLAHELAHVAQQGQAARGLAEGAPRRFGREGLSSADDPVLERSADFTAMRATMALHATAHGLRAGAPLAAPGASAGGLRLSRCSKSKTEDKDAGPQQDAGAQPDAGPQQPVMPLFRTLPRGGTPDTLGKGESLKSVADRAYLHHEVEYIQILRDANGIPESEDRKLKEGRSITVPIVQVPDPNTPPPAGTTVTPLVVPFGPVAQMTFDSEGHDTPGRPGYSRTPSVPPQASGVTVGRGYDMGSRSAADIEAQLTAAGVPPETAKDYGQGAGLKGDKASSFLKKHPNLPELTREQQWNLFIQEYYRVSNKALEDLARFELGRPQAQRVDLNNIDATTTQMLVDLKYRGDLTSGKWGSLRSLVHDSAAFNAFMQVRANWSSVPYDRYRRRCEALGLTAEPDDTTKKK
jgi:hypothetical protein